VSKPLAVIGVVAAVVFVAAGLGIADGPYDDRPLTGAVRDRATRAALQHVGAGTVTGTEADDEDGYEVEVRLEDGSQVEVELDGNLNVVSDERDDGPDTDDDGYEEPGAN
jgi:hypothetical protein